MSDPQGRWWLQKKDPDWLDLMAKQIQRVDRLSFAASYPAIKTKPEEMCLFLRSLLVGQQLRGDFYAAMKKAQKTDISFPIDDIAMDDITLEKNAVVLNPFTVALNIQVRISVQTELWSAIKEDRDPYPKFSDVPASVREMFEELTSCLDRSDGLQGQEVMDVEEKTREVMAIAESQGQSGVNSIEWLAKVEASARTYGRETLG